MLLRHPEGNIAPRRTAGCDHLDCAGSASHSYSFEAVLLLWFVTHMLAPSKAASLGWLPTAKVPTTAPSRARSLVTLLLPVFATQMCFPSNAIP